MDVRPRALALLACLVIYAGCDSNEELPGGAAEAFVGSWAFASASVTVTPGTEIDVTERFVGGADSSAAVFREDGTFEMVVTGDAGRIENEGTYTVNEGAGTITFNAVGFDEPGTFTYAVIDEGDRIVLQAGDVQFLVELSGLDVSAFTSFALSAVEEAEVVILKRPSA